MIINASTMSTLYTAFKASFAQGLASGANVQWQNIAEPVPSSTAINTYSWLGEFPKMREWIGDRVLKEIEGQQYQLINKAFEATVKVKRINIDDDQYGIYAPLMRSMGAAAAKFPDELVFDALVNGHVNLCYDGQPFFSANHVVTNGVFSATHSNIIAGAGQPWYLMYTGGAIKPLIYQQRQEPRFTPMTSDSDESVFMRAEYRYGADARSVAGYGFWQMALRSSAALDGAALDAAHDRLSGFTDEHGRPLAIVPDTLVVGRSNRAIANKLINAELINDGGVPVDNPYQGMYKLIYSPLLP